MFRVTDQSPYQRTTWRSFKKKRKSFNKQGDQKGGTCFICHKKGRYAKNCPQNKKGVHLISKIIDQFKIHIPDDLGSILSKKEELTNNTLVALQVF